MRHLLILIARAIFCCLPHSPIETDISISGQVEREAVDAIHTISAAVHFNASAQLLQNRSNSSLFETGERRCSTTCAIILNNISREEFGLHQSLSKPPASGNSKSSSNCSTIDCAIAPPRRTGTEAQRIAGCRRSRSTFCARRCNIDNQRVIAPVYLFWGYGRSCPATAECKRITQLLGQALTPAVDRLVASNRRKHVRGSHRARGARRRRLQGLRMNVASSFSHAVDCPNLPHHDRACPTGVKPPRWSSSTPSTNCAAHVGGNPAVPALFRYHRFSQINDNGLYPSGRSLQEKLQHRTRSCGDDQSNVTSSSQSSAKSVRRPFDTGKARSPS